MFGAGLDGGVELVAFVFADEVEYGIGAEHDFECGYAARASCAGYQGLGDNALEGGGELGADLLLVVGWEDVDNAVNGGGRTRGM